MHYIALLRAINVGGHNVSMEKLRGLFIDLGLDNVRSYIQTGNVFFESAETDRSKLAATIEAHLKKALRYEVPVILRTIEEVEAALHLNPFKGIELTKDRRFYILFAAQSISSDLALPFRSPTGEFEIISITPGEIFLVLTLKNGRSGNPAAFVEKIFNTKVTGRFFHTTAKILEAAQA